MPEPGRSDRDILIQVESNVNSLHYELLGGNGRTGRIPKLEDTQEEHAEKINSASGALKVVVYIMGGLGLAFLTLAGVVLTHILGGR